MDEQVEECPLCMEEMDLTDRHLRPCQCGYQMCVWCFHHIMEMASKDNSEGRCPACRTPYDRDKVISARINCEELLETVDKKKSHRSRSKAQEGRKHLNTVRVVQRNLVYIVGFPSSIAEEEALDRRDLFGQYGKILKVAVSRSPPHSSTVSVYVTFVRDEDALKCIKAVDGTSFQGRQLRATFGTNKYCHSWLKHSVCNNPDCLYLHDEGLDEDSFTKEEMLAKYNKNQHFHEHTKPRPAGTGLPPPLPETTTATTSRASGAKPVASTSTAKVTGLPAAASWGMRANAATTPKPVASKPPVAVPPKNKRPAATSSKAVCKDEEDAPSTSSNANSPDADEYTSKGGDGQASSQGSSSPDDLHFGRGFSEGDTNVQSWIEPPREDPESVWPETGPRSPTEDSTMLLNVGEVSISLNTSGVEAVPDGDFGRTEPPDNALSQSSGPTEDVISALDRIVLDGAEGDRPPGATTTGGDGHSGRQTGAAEERDYERFREECHLVAEILNIDINTDDGGLGRLYEYLSTGSSTNLEEFTRQMRPRSPQQSRFPFARAENQPSTSYESSPRPTASRFGSSDDQRHFSYNGSYDEQHRESNARHSVVSPEFTGQASGSKSRLFAPPGFAGTPPPGFSVRNINTRPISPAGRVSEYDLMDPINRGTLQNEQVSTRLRTQPQPPQLASSSGSNKHEVLSRQQQQQMYQRSNVEDVLGLISHQQQHGLYELDVFVRQQQQQERLMNERRAALYADANRMAAAAQYDESGAFSPGGARGYRSVSPLDAGSWMANAVGYGGAADVYSPEMKFKSSISRGSGHHIGGSSLRQGVADAKGLLYANGGPSLEQYLNDPSSFREADVQGAYV